MARIWLLWPFVINKRFLFPTLSLIYGSNICFNYASSILFDIQPFSLHSKCQFLGALIGI